MLALLMTRWGRVVTDDVFIDELWGDADVEAAKKSLRVRVSKLRRVLGAAAATIDHMGSGYRLVADPADVDIQRFRNAVARAVDADPERALAHADAALAEWTDEPFAEFPYIEVFMTARLELDALRREAVQIRTDALVDLDRAPEAIDLVLQERSRAPEDEALARAAMRALADAGRSSEALDVFSEVASALAERGLEPSPLTREYEEAVLTDRPVSRAAPSGTTPPPLWDRPIGRRDDVDGIARLVRNSALVSILGPAGVGKTRVAAELGQAISAEFEGVVWVPLVDAETVEEVAASIASALGVRSAADRNMVDSLTTSINRRRLLLVLDNCEQAAPAVGRVADALLGRCAGLRVVATSRVPLGSVRETRTRLAPLVLPAPSASAEDIASSPAVRLFLETAARVGAPPIDDMAELAALVIALDGLPLAIELVAARSALLTPRELLSRVRHRFDGLDESVAAGRSRSLRAAVGWSMDLLDDDARLVLSRATVLRAGFSVEAMEAVGSGAPIEQRDVLGAIGRLVDHSLLEVSTVDGSRRGHLLEAIRLVAADMEFDADASRRRLVHFYADRIAAIAAMDVVDAVAEMRREMHQMTHAFDLAADLDPDAMVAMAHSAAWFWSRHGDWNIGLSWYDRALELGVPDDPELALSLLQGAAALNLFGRGDPDTAEHQYRAAIGVADQADLVRPYNGLSLVFSFQGDYETAIDLLRRQVDQDGELGRSSDVPLANLAHLMTELGRLDDAETYSRRAKDESRRHGSGVVSHTRLIDAQIAWQRGDHDEAINVAEALLEEWQANGLNIEHQAGILHLMAQVELGRDRLDGALVHLTAAAKLLPVIDRDLPHHLLLLSELARRRNLSELSLELSEAALGRLGEREQLFPSRRSLIRDGVIPGPRRSSGDLIRLSAAALAAVTER